MKISIMISVGSWGGVYFYRGFGWRFCIGWVAVTFFPVDGDDILYAASEYLADKGVAEVI